MNDWCPVTERALDFSLAPFVLLTEGEEREMKLDIPYASIDEQIQKLESQNLIIDDRRMAAQLLQIYGYSNLIKSYREPYIIVNKEGKKIYRNGITFQHISSLYLLDKNLRNAIMASMLDLEEHIKELSADVIASSFGTDPDIYLAWRNYRDKKKTKSRFTLDSVLKTIKNHLNTDKNPVAHYREKYGIVPPWILFKSLYFSTIINFIDKFKHKEKRKLALLLYDAQELGLGDEAIIKLMADTLAICSDYRNTAAHGGRIYNHIPKSDLRDEEIFGRTLNMAGIGQLLFLLSLLKYETPYVRLKRTLQTELSRHCGKYPEDITYISQIIRMNIEAVDIVYVTSKSNKYHKNPYCSGLNDAKQIDIREAIEKKYEPCKKCFGSNATGIN